MLTAIGQYVDEQVVQGISSSPFLALMCDEATDLNTLTELSVCMRYLNSAGCSVECFLEIVPVPDTKAETITAQIVSTLESRSIDFSKIVWVACDGASNMSGNRSGVQAHLREGKCPDVSYVHCRSHLLQLACVNSCDKIKPIKKLFSAINSLYQLFSQSPKRTQALREVQDVLEDSKLSLVQPGDTRWSSHFRAIRAVIKCLNSIITTLQHLHQDSGDLSSEAGGLLLTFQDSTSIVLLFAVKNILTPVPINTLSLKLQNENAALCDFSDFLEATMYHFEEIISKKEYISLASDFEKESGIPLLSDGGKMTTNQIHQKLVIPYIKVLSENIKKQFDDKIVKMCSATEIFNPTKVCDDTKYGESSLIDLASLSNDVCIADVKDEWKSFRNYLRVKSYKDNPPSGKEILQKLASKTMI